MNVGITFMVGVIMDPIRQFLWVSLDKSRGCDTKRQLRAVLLGASVIAVSRPNLRVMWGTHYTVSPSSCNIIPLVRAVQEIRTCTAGTWLLNYTVFIPFQDQTNRLSGCHPLMETEKPNQNTHLARWHTVLGTWAGGFYLLPWTVVRLENIHYHP